MMTRAYLKICALSAAAAGAAALAVVIAPASAQSLPNGNGKELVERVCSACHDLSPITDHGFSRADWEAVIANMNDMGAMIPPDQAMVIANYLATNFPPKTK